MPIDFPSSPTVGQLYTFGGVTYAFTAQGVWATAGASAIAVIGGSPQGRLTLQSATPVMTTTQSAKTTIYYTPYVGNQVPIYDGSNMTMTTFAEVSVGTTDATKSPAAIGASKVNDWFVWSDAGTIRIGHGPDWTSDTARSAGTALVMVNGILLNSVSITNGPAASRGTYVGTMRSNGSSQLDFIIGGFAVGGTAAFIGIWNAYNRRPAAFIVSDTTASYTYAVIAWQAANGSSSMRCSFVRGLDDDAIIAIYCNTVDGTSTALAVGLDQTTNPSGTTGWVGTQTIHVPLFGTYVGCPGIGFHFVSAIEKIYAGTSTFYNSAVADLHSGFITELWY